MASEGKCEILSWINLPQSIVYRITEVVIIGRLEVENVNQDKYILSLADINNSQLKVWGSKKLIDDLNKRGPMDEPYLVSLGRQRCQHNRTLDLYELDFQTGAHHISLFTRYSKLSSQKRRSLHSENHYAKRIKLTDSNDDGNCLAMFDKIPFEILLLMVQYLPKTSLIAWNRVNKRFYDSSIQKLWHHPGSWLWNKARMHQLSHLPIQILNSKMIRDSTELNIVTTLPKSLKIYILDDWIYESEDFLKFLDTKVTLVVDAGVLCRSQEENDVEENYLDTLNDLNIKVELGPIGKAHTYGEPCIEMIDDNDLKELTRCHFKQFYVERIKHMEEKDDLIDFLLHTKIDEIYLNFFQFYVSHCKFERHDIAKIKNCNIKSIATSALYRANYMTYAENPWVELSQIKSLKDLIINPWTDLSLYRLQSFSFYAITIGNEKKRFVSSIVELRDLFECRCISVSTRVQGPMWIYKFGVYVIIHLTNSQ